MAITLQIHTTGTSTGDERPNARRAARDVAREFGPVTRVAWFALAKRLG
jgi:hypothetical protein